MKNNRLEQIERILRVQKEASVMELASRLKVSDMTIRRDLIELEQKGIVDIMEGLLSLPKNPKACFQPKTRKSARRVKQR